jgi:hypothetical protein
MSVEFDFSQNTKVADVNKIPQDFRGLYRQDGENYILDSEQPGVKSAISAITGLNNALKAARAEAKNKPGPVDLTPLKTYGEDPASIATKIQETIDGLKGQIKGVDIEKIKKDLATEYTGKLTSAETITTALEGQLYNELVESRAMTAIASEKGDVELLLPFVKNHIKAVRTPDNKYAVHVVDQAGDIRYSGVTGAPMSIKELVGEMKSNEKYGKLFASEALEGAGLQPGSASRKSLGSGGNPVVANRAEMSSVDKISAGLKKGQARRGA